MKRAVVVGVFVAVVPPVAYMAVSHTHLANKAAFVAQLQAGRLSKYIYTHEAMWQYQRVRMAEIVELDGAQSDVTMETVFDLDGDEVLTVGRYPGRLRLSQSSDLIVAGRPIGRVEVSIPLFALAVQTTIIAIVSLLMGFAAYFARALPLRSLHGAVRKLEDSSKEILHRTERLAEAQTIGRIGDWSYDFGTGKVWWADEIYALLGYDQNFAITYERVMSLYVDGGAQRLLDVQRESFRSGKISVVDLKVRRGDGTTGYFAITTKARTDADGKPTGIYGTIQDITDRKEAEKQLEKLAYHDPLTGLANRSLFHRHIGEVIGRCQRTGSTGALLLLDLDRFKDVNDTLGHAIGDALLVRVAHLLARTLGAEHFVARLGGDEFAIVLEGLSERLNCETIATDILGDLSGTTFLERVEVAVGTSIGIARIVEHGASATDLLRNADLALYRAKEEGRGRYVVFEAGMDEAVQQKVAIATDLRNALGGDSGLSVHYQPLIDLVSGRVTGFEALLRWAHPERGNIPPTVFIPIAESSHLICDLGYWVLRQAVMQAKQWLDAGAPPREIAVNISAAQIWNTDLVADVKSVLEETGFPPDLLCLELTESLLINLEENRVRSVLKALKALGVVLALDDFGTGFSSLGYLTQLPFDKLKIDRVFIDGSTESVRKAELLRGIIGLGQGLGMITVAEGAEKPEEVELLRKLGCDVVQGFIFARPTPADIALTFALQQDSVALMYAAQTTPDDAAGAVAAAG
ncbi:EAL domain-containing protein [Hoeflea sp. G2-23]|uniref:EAL domain-containing protein n=1 Tax=Hoeflea algicola TaxID=2983763 RepID=A0ABT3Z7K0_9HYPH|nr:bifunctional diguanylate cyclase/phosphodiesterase [Hoeflea algicola]MCY0147319.1 EAL domain-containing protein [Hoeflea algicola]